MREFTVTTAFPPSTNSLFRNVRGKGRVKTERYRDWRSAAGWDFQQAQIARNNPPPHEGPVEVWIDLVMPDARRRDIDNFCKALIDQAVEHRVIADDDQIESLRVRKVPRGCGFDGARMTIWPIAERNAA